LALPLLGPSRASSSVTRAASFVLGTRLRGHGFDGIELVARDEIEVGDHALTRPFTMVSIVLKAFAAPAALVKNRAIPSRRRLFVCMVFSFQPSVGGLTRHKPSYR
jgi:hypothetical protein